MTVDLAWGLVLVIFCFFAGWCFGWHAGMKNGADGWRTYE
jgi:hypothetical protein